MFTLTYSYIIFLSRKLVKSNIVFLTVLWLFHWLPSNLLHFDKGISGLVAKLSGIVTTCRAVAGSFLN
jgi:hypothetical protein